MSTMAFKVVILTFLLAPFTLALPQSAAKPVASPPPIGGSNAPGTGHGEFSLPGTGNVGPGSVTGYGPHILHAGEVVTGIAKYYIVNPLSAKPDAPGSCGVPLTNATDNVALSTYHTNNLYKSAYCDKKICVTLGGAGGRSIAANMDNECPTCTKEQIVLNYNTWIKFYPDPSKGKLDVTWYIMNDGDKCVYKAPQRLDSRQADVQSGRTPGPLQRLKRQLLQ